MWVFGNGGRGYDSCVCDGYINSVYILFISFVIEYGTFSWYLEYCVLIFVIIFSSGNYEMRKIVCFW